jgi:hypothetical protein
LGSEDIEPAEVAELDILVENSDAERLLGAVRWGSEGVGNEEREGAEGRAEKVV